MEKSWYRCIFPFGIISLVIGVAGTSVTYTYNDLPQTKVVSVVLLIVGLVLVLMATACWTAHKKKRRKKKEAAIAGATAAVNTAISPWHSCRRAMWLLLTSTKEVGQRGQLDTASKEECNPVTIARHSPVL
ncbi:hypothetical protein MHYP_G00143560 [Metynnis hypsauchen]